MFDLNEPIGHWGYLAIFLFVLLGILGLPLPEETILVLGGYLAWKGELISLAAVVVGIIGTVVGDNFGYWIGRHYGTGVVLRYSRWLLATPNRLSSAQRFVTRYGPLGIFLARFLPVCRFMAG